MNSASMICWLISTSDGIGTQTGRKRSGLSEISWIGAFDATKKPNAVTVEADRNRFS